MIRAHIRERVLGSVGWYTPGSARQVVLESRDGHVVSIHVDGIEVSLDIDELGRALVAFKTFTAQRSPYA